MGFATGYNPAQRERLVDVYMEDFRDIFGRYPSSAGSWFIDTHTLAYMHERYGVEASCNVKDQIGADGYTLWGGYWAGAYYPSRQNAYMPAQTAEGQIPVPVFRMLGSDPIYQYDSGLGTDVQQVESLEPVYLRSGGDPEWIRYFLGSLADNPALGFTYCQAGQENSFTWKAMERGLREQLRVVDSLRTAGSVRVATLRESARWFREHYPLTPATGWATLRDVRGEGRQALWFNSRHYRANLLLQDGAVLLRDVHFFDERLQSRYYDTAGQSPQCVYGTLPVVDGYRFSTPRDRAGIYLCLEEPGGGWAPIRCGGLDVTTAEGLMAATVRDSASGRAFTFEFTEQGWCVAEHAPAKGAPGWCLALALPREKFDVLPDCMVSTDRLDFEHEGFRYQLSLSAGGAEIPAQSGLDPLTIAWLLRPEGNLLAAGPAR